MSADNSNLKYYVDLSAQSADELVGTMLKEHGLCTFDAPLAEEELAALAKRIGFIVYHPDADAIGVMHIEPDEEKVDVANGIGGAFTREALPLHTDGKGVTEYIDAKHGDMIRKGPADFFIFQAVIVEDPSNAIPVFCDGHALYEELQKNNAPLFDFLNSPEAITRYTTQPNYTYKGPLFEKTKDGVAIRFNVDESENWPEGYLQQFLDTANKLRFEMQLKTGQGYIIDNRRMMHARTAISKNTHREARHILIYVDKAASIGKHLPCYSC